MASARIDSLARPPDASSPGDITTCTPDELAQLRRWAGLYKEEDQLLYVNRGFGFIGFPGRVGMPPEITVLELQRS